MHYSVEDATNILSRTPVVLRALLSGLPPNWTHQNEGGDSWSPYDVIGHLVHGEKRDWTERLSLILESKELSTFKPFDRFAQFEESKGKSLDELLDEFTSLRMANVALLKGLRLTSLTLEKTAIHPSFGVVTLRQLLSTWVILDLDHLVQISRTMAQNYREEVGPWQAFLSIVQPRKKADAFKIGAELIEMAKEDLTDDFVRRRHGTRFLEILETIGWPRRSLVGDEAAASARLIFKSALGAPEFRQRGLALLKAAESVGEA